MSHNTSDPSTGSLLPWVSPVKQTPIRMLILGATGFIGSSMRRYFDNRFEMASARLDESSALLEQKVLMADVIVNAAGVSRSKGEADFFRFNYECSMRLIDMITRTQSKTILYFSSIHFQSNDVYGIGKRYNEYLLSRPAVWTANRVYCFRTPGVFGPGSRPDYVSVVSTFCYRLIQGLEIKIFDPDKLLQLIFIEDLLLQIDELMSREWEPGYFLIEPSTTTISVGDLFRLVQDIHANRSTPQNDGLSTEPEFYRKLQKTYNHFVQT